MDENDKQQRWRDKLPTDPRLDPAGYTPPPGPEPQEHGIHWICGFILMPLPTVLYWLLGLVKLRPNPYIYFGGWVAVYIAIVVAVSVVVAWDGSSEVRPSAATNPLPTPTTTTQVVRATSVLGVATTAPPEVPTQTQMLLDYENNVYTPSWPQYVQCLEVLGGTEGQERALLALPGIGPISGYYLDNNGEPQYTGEPVTFTVADDASSTTLEAFTLNNLAYDADVEFFEQLQALGDELSRQGFGVGVDFDHPDYYMAVYDIALLTEFSTTQWQAVAQYLIDAMKLEGVAVDTALAVWRILSPGCDQ